MDESRKINTEPNFGGMHFGLSDRCKEGGMCVKEQDIIDKAEELCSDPVNDNKLQERL